MRSWTWYGVCALLLGTAACSTRKNPAAVCHDGTCLDPSFPYCDSDGAIGGEPGTCISVDCMPGAFGACRADGFSLVCNVTGHNYDAVECANGCDPTVGCLACMPNQTVCANGAVASCDGAGHETLQTCPLGCFEDQPRCRDIDPSNGLGQYLDMVTDPPDLDVPAGHIATIDTTAGTITMDGTTIDIPSFLATAPAGGVDVRVFVAGKVTLSGNVDVHATTPPGVIAGAALAILAVGDVVIDGHVANNGSAGSSLDLACAGGKARETDNGMQGIIGGSGGGGFATPGASGGGVNYGSGIPPGLGGGICGNAALVPLRGGGAGGGFDDDNGQYVRLASPGGGAIQLVSRTKVTIDGVVNLDGSSSPFYQIGNAFAVAGGGAGGALLVEGPSVELGAATAILARGMGGSANGPAFDYVEDANPIPGETCNPGLGAGCGVGGAGASADAGAAPGTIASYISGLPVMSGGGGGGGLGRLRINTPDATYTKSSTTIEAAAVSTGTLATR